MAQMSHFCRQWRLKPSASKTISSVFYLHNTSTTRELSVYLDGQRLRHKYWVPPNLFWDDSRPYAVLQRTLDKDCTQAEVPKQLVDKASRFHLGRQRQPYAVICSGALLFRSRVLRPCLVMLCSHKSTCSWTLPCASSLVPSVLHLSHGFQCSPVLNRQPYEGRLPLTSWWRKSSNMTVGQSSLISLAHHCCDWHPGNHCGWTCKQLTSKVDGGITGSRLRWSILT